MIVYMPQYMLAGWTKFVILRWGTVMRLHIERIMPFGWRFGFFFPLGILRIDFHKKADLDELAEKYIDRDAMARPLSDEDVAWAEKVIKELGLDKELEHH